MHSVMVEGCRFSGSKKKKKKAEYCHQLANHEEDLLKMITAMNVMLEAKVTVYFIPLCPRHMKCGFQPIPIVKPNVFRSYFIKGCP